MAERELRERILGLLLLVMVAVTPRVAAQSLSQDILGTLTDAVTFLPVPDALVTAKQGDRRYLQTTDSNGTFRFDSIPVGRYTIVIQHLSYSAARSEILVTSSRPVTLSFELQPAVNVLSEIVISSMEGLPEIRSTGVRNLGVEETQRTAATFFDPARLAAIYPGINFANDAGNNLVARGNSPNSVSWRLEGVEIVNPNHLANTGTISDRPTRSGGGVNILSAQLLDNSSIILGGFDADLGNATGSIFDMNFRKGNNSERNIIAQAGLIGLDLAAEGPFRENGEGSWLVNYRYSTVGLITSLGVDFGDESINFQDLAFNVNLPLGKGEISVFGMGGVSSNDFNAERDTSAWEFDKDRQDIFFDSRMGAAGISFRTPLGSRSGLLATVVQSGLKHEREASLLSDNFDVVYRTSDDHEENRLSTRFQFNTRIGSATQLHAGVYASHIDSRVGSAEADFVNLILIAPTISRSKGWLHQPYLSLNHELTDNLTLNGGIHYQYFEANNSASTEPRVALSWKISGSHRLNLSFSKMAQLLTPGTYSRSPVNNQELGFIKSRFYNAAWFWMMKSDLLFRLEGYYQDLYNVPVQATPSTFSYLNVVDEGINTQLVSDGTGTNYGMELSLQRFLNSGLYFVTGATYYNSTYSGSDGIEYDTRFNGNYAVNFVAGKEFVNQDKNRLIGINLGGIVQGGLRDNPVDLASSRAAGTTVYDATLPFSVQNDPYFKLDLKITFRKEKLGYTRYLFIDIQNISNRENDAYQFYDNQMDAVIFETQLGIIPILTYRLEF